MEVFGYTDPQMAQTNRGEKDVQMAQRDLREAIRLCLNRKRNPVDKKIFNRAFRWEVPVKK